MEWQKFVKGSCAFFIFILTLIRPAGADAEVRPPVLSRQGGCYDEAFYLGMTSPDGCMIRYTVDCGDPTGADALVYTEPLFIENIDDKENVFSAITDISLWDYEPQTEPVPKCIVVRAVCVSADGAVSDEITESYFISRTESCYDGFGIISLTADTDGLFGEENGIFSVGSGYYEWKNSDLYEEYVHAGDPANPTNYSMRGRDWEREAVIEVFRDGKSVLNQRVGVRVRGNYTRVNPQKSITIYARKEYGRGKLRYDFFDGKCLDANGEAIMAFDRLCLSSGSNEYTGARIRDELNQLLMGQSGLGVQSMQPYIVFINGEFWGMYTAQEKEDDHYIAAHYGVDKDNVTIVKCGELEDGSQEMLDAYHALYDRAMSADFSDSEQYALLAQQIDTDGLIDLFAGQSYVCNYDFAVNINNWAIWRVNEPDGTEYGDGKWRFLVYDTEYSLSMTDPEYYTDPYNVAYYFDYLNNMDLTSADFGLPALLAKLVRENTDFRARFRERYIELMDTVYSAENVLPLIDAIAAPREEAYADTVKRFGVHGTDYAADVERIVEFFRYRREYALVSLNRFCADPEACSSGDGE